jgi:hypothetical protein
MKAVKNGDGHRDCIAIDCSAVCPLAKDNSHKLHDMSMSGDRILLYFSTIAIGCCSKFDLGNRKILGELWR